MIVPACAYQGGKGRLAKEIVDYISPSKYSRFYDLCCGSGAVSIELINRGHNPEDITMVDIGCWGLFWSMIGQGTFDLTRFAVFCESVPKDPREIKDHVTILSKQSSLYDTVYVYLLLQAASFGSKAIWTKDNKWHNTSFRDYWLPTETSNRRSPVNPMMPMPDTLFERIKAISESMYGVVGIQADITNISPEENSIVYIDPPYDDTSGYSSKFDVSGYSRSLGSVVYVSEGKPVSPVAICLSQGRSKGGISGTRKKANEEWISVFNSDFA